MKSVFFLKKKFIPKNIPKNIPKKIPKNIPKKHSKRHSKKKTSQKTFQKTFEKKFQIKLIRPPLTPLCLFEENIGAPGRMKNVETLPCPQGGDETRHLECKKKLQV